MSKKIIIAIDGPAGSGKSTVAKKVARSLGILYLDSGAFYRAVTLAFLRNDFVPPFDKPGLTELLRSTQIELKGSNDSIKVLLNDEDVSSEIRLQKVTASVSEVSENKLVREIITDKLRQLAETESVVMDGRDIGTVVFPDAGLKIFMTASPEERAKRRYVELAEKDAKADFDEIKQTIIKRDTIDSSREIAPLSQAEDAIFLDTTGMTINEVVDFIIKEYKKLK